MDHSWIWLFHFLGRLHPLVVHFPIGLLVIALLMEMISLNGKKPGLREGINWMVYLGAFFAVISAFLGWLLVSHDDYSDELVKWHQYLGISTAILSVLTAFILHRTEGQKLSRYIGYRIVLFLTVVTLLITGHLGAGLTHGEDFLSSTLPWNQSDPIESNAKNFLTNINGLDTLTSDQHDQLNLEVRQIMAHNCYQCHSEHKHKGDLVLENKRGVFKGGKSGPVIIPGFPERSEIFKRITLHKNHEDVMPQKGKLLNEYEITLFKLWIKNGANWSDRSLEIFPEAPLALTNPGLPVGSKEPHPIDKIIDEYFNINNVPWPNLIDDQTFIRRIYLDIIGLLPEPQKVSQFINDPNPGKREKLIDELLADDLNYTEHWLSFWNDLLRNDYSGPGFITGGRKQITDWLYLSLENNKPYNLMVRELVNPDEDAEGFIKGIEWRGTINASQRTEMQAAQNIGQSLMGINVKCASCHNSFVSNLTLKQTYGFASIFSKAKMELNRCDMPLGEFAVPEFIYKELGSVEAESVKERLLKLSEIIVKPENGRLYRTVVNRIWKRLLGRGIVEPVDEMDQPPWHSSLLDWIAADFINADFNLKYLLRTIVTSKTYQLPVVSYKSQEDTRVDFVFKGPLQRRMSAEQFSDAVSQIVSPMYYAAAYNPTIEDLSFRRFWHREVKFERDVLPEPGKRYFRKILKLKDKELLLAKALISVDNSYVLFINGKRMSEGDDWRKSEKLDIKAILVEGENIIAIEGVNKGPLAKPAGILFAIQIQYTGEDDFIIDGRKGWKSSANKPGEQWTSLKYKMEDWQDVRDFGTKNWGQLVNYTFTNDVKQFARASLVEQHPFLKAMGRPSRENVTSSRDDMPTLLQALELTNGTYFNNVLEEGAIAWLEEYSEKKELIPELLYSKAFGRDPTSPEKTIMRNALGDDPGKEELQDLFWSTVLLPEFQFIN